MKLLKSLRKYALWYKFLAVGLLWLAMVSVPATLYWKEIGRQLGIYRYEQQGLAPAQMLLDIMQRTQQHRSLTAAYLHEDPGLKNSPLKKERRAKAEELQEAIVVLEDYSRKIKNTKIEKTLAEITADWHQISQLVTVRELSLEQNFHMHHLLMRKQLDALQMILDTYQLSRDPEPGGYYLISSSLMALPSLVEIAAQLDTAGASLLRRGEADFAQRVELKSLLVLAAGRLAELDLGIARAASANTASREAIQQHYGQARQQYQLLLQTTQEEILSRASFSFTPEQFSQVSAQSTRAYYDFIRFSIANIDTLLKQRIEDKNRAIHSLFTFIYLLTAAVFFIYAWVVIKLIRQLGGEPDYAIAVVQAIGRGELQQNIVASNRNSLLANLHIMQARLRERMQKH